MDHYSFVWNTENCILYQEMLIVYYKQRKNATRKKADIEKMLCTLKNGYRPLNLSKYL